MSLARLSREEAYRQTAAQAGAPVKRPAPAGRLHRGTEAARPSPPAPVETAGHTETAMDQLTKYIPTEMITIFLAAVSAWNVLNREEGGFLAGMAPLVLILVFTVLTPAVLLLMVYATFAETRRRTGNADMRFTLPWFSMVAAALAFFVWAFAVPGLYPGREALQVLAAFGALVVSFILSQVRRIVGPEA